MDATAPFTMMFSTLLITLLFLSGRFLNNFVEMFLKWPTFRFLQAMLIDRKTWPPGDETFLPYMGLSENLKNLNSLPKVFGRFSNNFVEIFLGWPSIRFPQAMLIGRKLWQPGGGAYMAKVKKMKSGERYRAIMALLSYLFITRLTMMLLMRCNDVIFGCVYFRLRKCYFKNRKQVQLHANYHILDSLFSFLYREGI